MSQERQVRFAGSQPLQRSTSKDSRDSLSEKGESHTHVPSDSSDSDQRDEKAGGQVPEEHGSTGKSTEDAYDAIGLIESRGSRASAEAGISRVGSRASANKDAQVAAAPIPVTELDKGIIGWDSQEDPNMPLNFSPARKWTTVSLLSLISFMTPFASTTLAPAIEFYNEEFGNSDPTIGAFPVSIYLLGYAAAPLILSPLSEIYGRTIVLNSANVVFCAFLIGCALAPTLDSLIVLRFLTGAGGSACITLGGGIIVDLMEVEQRGFAQSIWTLGPLIGPSIGPIAGAWIAQTIGWRWSNWIVLIPSVLTTAVIIFLVRETNHKVLIKRKVRRAREELGRPELRSCYEDPEGPSQTTSAVLRRGLIRPLKMLFCSPLVFGLGLYIAFAYGLVYLLYNAIPLVFQDIYGWSLGLTGLAYIPLGIGYLIGLAIFGYTSDRTVVRMTKANNGVYEPEMRLPDCIWFACVLPITFFWYGWSAYFHVHWIVPVLGLLPFGIGILGIWQPILAYVIDSYPEFAASGVAAITVFRSVVAAFLPLAGPKMYESLGLGWGNSLLGFICIAMIPVPAITYKFGGRLRKWQNLQL